MDTLVERKPSCVALYVCKPQSREPGKWVKYIYKIQNDQLRSGILSCQMHVAESKYQVVFVFLSNVTLNIR